MFNRATGGRGGLVHFGILALTVLNLVAALQTMGVVLGLGLFLLPAVTAYLWCDHFARMLILAVLVAMVCSVAGILLSATCCRHRERGLDRPCASGRFLSFPPFSARGTAPPGAWSDSCVNAMSPELTLTAVKSNRFLSLLQAIQDRICAGLEEEGRRRSAFPRRHTWERAEGGGGRTRILTEGAVFEKAGVAFSHVHGERLPPAASAHRPELAGQSWEAVGVSVVVHPLNPVCADGAYECAVFFDGGISGRGGSVFAR